MPLFLAILTQKIYVLDVIDQLTLAESLSMSGPAYSPDDNYDVYDNNMLIELWDNHYHLQPMESLPNLSMSGPTGRGLVQYTTSHETNNRWQKFKTPIA